MFILLPVVLFKPTVKQVFCDIKLEMVEEHGLESAEEVQWRYINTDHIHSISVSQDNYTDLEMSGDGVVQTIDLPVAELIEAMYIQEVCGNLSSAQLARMTNIPALIREGEAGE